VIRSQGKCFSSSELEKILFLLKETDLALSLIATRMRCSRSAVASINRRFQIRDYAGHRNNWVLAGSQASGVARRQFGN